MDTNACRCFVYSVAQAMDSATDHNTNVLEPGEFARANFLHWAWQIKFEAAKNVAHVVDKMLHACGGSGYKRDMELERYLRDAKAGWVMGPTNEVLRQFVGKAVLLGFESLDYWNQTYNRRAVENEVKKLDAAGQARARRAAARRGGGGGGEGAGEGVRGRGDRPSCSPGLVPRTRARDVTWVRPGGVDRRACRAGRPADRPRPRRGPGRRGHGARTATGATTRRARPPGGRAGHHAAVACRERASADRSSRELHARGLDPARREPRAAASATVPPAAATFRADRVGDAGRRRARRAGSSTATRLRRTCGSRSSARSRRERYDELELPPPLAEPRLDFRVDRASGARLRGARRASSSRSSTCEGSSARTSSPSTARKLEDGLRARPRRHRHALADGQRLPDARASTASSTTWTWSRSSRSCATPSGRHDTFALACTGQVLRGHGLPRPRQLHGQLQRASSTPYTIAAAQGLAGAQLLLQHGLRPRQPADRRTSRGRARATTCCCGR